MVEQSPYGNYYPERVIRAAHIMLARHRRIPEAEVTRARENDPQGLLEIGWLAIQINYILDPSEEHEPTRWPYVTPELIQLARGVAGNTIRNLSTVVRKDVPEVVFDRIIGDDGLDPSMLLEPVPA